jgi:hypothetical protein
MKPWQVLSLVCCVFGFEFLGTGVAIAENKGEAVTNAAGEKCVECHAKATPNVVNDWKLSKHSSLGIGCEACHGTDHTTAEDAAKAKIPTPETCGQCHSERVEQFKKGKHAIALGCNGSHAHNPLPAHGHD